MSSNTRSRRIKGLIAGAAGAALLLGGTTFALWSDSDSFGGASVIKAGNLDLDLGAPSIWDISTSGETWNGTARGDQQTTIPGIPGGLKGHRIDNPGDYAVSPADTDLAVYPFEVTLVGDNLVAKLSLTTTANGADLVPGYAEIEAAGLENVAAAVTVDVYLGTSTTPIKSTPYSWKGLHDLAAGDEVEIALLEAAQTGQGAGRPDSDPAAPGTAPTALTADTVSGAIAVKIKIPNFIGQQAVTATLLDTTTASPASAFGLKLEQTRDTTTGWF
jgi:alternate signal-mediated exported protein